MQIAPLVSRAIEKQEELEILMDRRTANIFNKALNIVCSLAMCHRAAQAEAETPQ